MFFPASTRIVTAMLGFIAWLGLYGSFWLLQVPTDLFPLWLKVTLTVIVAWSSTLMLLRYWLVDRWLITVSTLLAGSVLLLVPAVRTPGPKDVLLLLVVLGVGGLISECFRRPGFIAAILLLASVSDTISLYHPAGPTRQIQEKVPHLLNLFSLQYPVPGSGRWLSVLGFADWLILAVVTGMALRMDLPAKKMLYGCFGGLLVLFLVTLLTTPQPALPAIPFMSLGLLIPLVEEPRLRDGLGLGLGVGLPLLVLGLPLGLLLLS